MTPAEISVLSGQSRLDAGRLSGVADFIYKVSIIFGWLMGGIGIILALVAVFGRNIGVGLIVLIVTLILCGINYICAVLATHIAKVLANISMAALVLVEKSESFADGVAGVVHWEGAPRKSASASNGPNRADKADDPQSSEAGGASQAALQAGMESEIKDVSSCSQNELEQLLEEMGYTVSRTTTADGLKWTLSSGGSVSYVYSLEALRSRVQLLLKSRR